MLPCACVGDRSASPCRSVPSYCQSVHRPARCAITDPETTSSSGFARLVGSATAHRGCSHNNAPKQTRDNARMTGCAQQSAVARHGRAHVVPSALLGPSAPQRPQSVCWHCEFTSERQGTAGAASPRACQSSIVIAHRVWSAHWPAICRYRSEYPSSRNPTRRTNASDA